MKPPFRSQGGHQQVFQREILKHVPEHSVFVQPFFGGGSIFWSKDKAAKEVINDIDPRLVRALKDLRKAHGIRCDMTPDKARFHKIKRRGVKTLCDFLYLNKQSYGGNMKSFGDQSRKCYGVPKTCGIKQLKAKLSKYRERLKNVKIENKDWREVLKAFDSKDTLFFIDPPYASFTKARGCKWDKGCGMDPAEIKKGIRGLKGKILITEGNDPETRKVFCRDKRFRCSRPFTHRSSLARFDGKGQIVKRKRPKKLSHLIITRH